MSTTRCFACDRTRRYWRLRARTRFARTRPRPFACRDRSQRRECRSRERTESRESCPRSPGPRSRPEPRSRRACRAAPRDRRFELFAVDVVELELHVTLESGVHQGLVQGFVRIAQVDVLADERDRHVTPVGSHVAVDGPPPDRKVRVTRPDVEPLGEQAIEALLVKGQRKLVNHAAHPARRSLPEPARCRSVRSSL